MASQELMVRTQLSSATSSDPAPTSRLERSYSPLELPKEEWPELPKEEYEVEPWMIPLTAKHLVEHFERATNPKERKRVRDWAKAHPKVIYQAFNRRLNALQGKFLFVIKNEELLLTDTIASKSSGKPQA